jgi:aspartokinase
MNEVFGLKVNIMRNCSAVSLLGTGITDRHTYLLDALSLLRKSEIPIAGLQTSSFRISFLPERSRMNEVVQLFHSHFLERPDLKDTGSAGVPPAAASQLPTPKQ